VKNFIVVLHFYLFFCLNATYSQNNNLTDLYKNCQLNLNVIVNLNDNSIDKVIEIDLTNNTDYQKKYSIKPGAQSGLVIPFGSIYDLRISCEGYATKWIIINLKDSLTKSDLFKLRKRKYKFFWLKEDKNKISASKTLSSSTLFVAEFLLFKTEGLPSIVSNQMKFDFPLGTIIYDKKKKRFDYNETYLKAIRKKLEQAYLKAELLMKNPELMDDFKDLNDSLKEKEFLIAKKNEEILLERLELIEKKRINEKLEVDKKLNEVELEKLHVQSISRKKDLELVNQLRINEKQKNIQLKLSQQIEQEKFRNQKAIDEEKIKQQSILNESKQKELELAKQEKKSKELEINNQQIRQNFLFALALFIALIAILFIRAFYLKRRTADNLAVQNIIIEEQKQEIIDSIEYAKRIQTAILPPPRIVKDFLKDSFILYLPKDIVAGDFYWMEGMDDKVYFAACDCTGHGVPGAMVSVVCNNALNRALNEFGKRLPGEIFDKTRELVLENFSKSDEEVQDGMDASLAVLDIKSRRLLWAGANNPLWILRKNFSNESVVDLEEIKADKQPIGIGYDSKPFTTHEIQLNEGDTIYLFTDGFADQFGGKKGRKMTKAKFRDFLLSIFDLPMEEQRIALLNFHDSYRGKEGQVDDICVIGVRV
jgi:serine phosphatase RsbU (regulator of sigma subunit)